MKCVNRYRGESVCFPPSHENVMLVQCLCAGRVERSATHPRCGSAVVRKERACSRRNAMAEVPSYAPLGTAYAQPFSTTVAPQGRTGCRRQQR